MNSNNEYIDTQNERFSNNTVRRKATQEPMKKLNIKKIWINITNTDFKTKKLSYVWKYFQTENGYDICKILAFLKDKEVECKKSYKHDGRTGNMK